MFEQICRPKPSAPLNFDNAARSAIGARRRGVALALTALAFVPCIATAQVGKMSAANFQAVLWGSSCMACHGTDGKAEGVARAIGGRPAEELLTALLEYKADKRQGTVMPQHVKGYSDDELKRIAEFFSRVK